MFTAEQSLNRSLNNYAGLAMQRPGAPGIVPANSCGVVCPDGTTCNCYGEDARSSGKSGDRYQVSCPAGAPCNCGCDGELGSMANCGCL